MFNYHSLIPWIISESTRRKVGIISGLGSFRGRFGDHFRVGDHFGVGIISGAVHTSAAAHPLTNPASYTGYVFSRKAGVLLNR